MQFHVNYPIQRYSDHVALRSDEASLLFLFPVAAVLKSCPVMLIGEKGEHLVKNHLTNDLTLIELSQIFFKRGQIQINLSLSNFTLGTTNGVSDDQCNLVHY
jgi:hypothetical protein